MFDFKNKFSPEKLNILALLVLLLVISAVVGTYSVVLGIICFVATAVSTSVSFFISFWKSEKDLTEYTKSISEKFAKASGDVFVVTDEDDRIVWRSGAFEKYFVIDVIKRPTLFNVTGGELDFSKIMNHITVNTSPALGARVVAETEYTKSSVLNR